MTNRTIRTDAELVVLYRQALSQLWFCLGWREQRMVQELPVDALRPELEGAWKLAASIRAQLVEQCPVKFSEMKPAFVVVAEAAYERGRVSAGRKPVDDIPASSWARELFP